MQIDDKFSGSSAMQAETSSRKTALTKKLSEQSMFPHFLPNTSLEENSDAFKYYDTLRRFNGLPGVVRYLHCVSIPGWIVLILERLEGSLCSQEKEFSAKPWKDKIKILLGATQVFGVMHQNNIVHGSIKPGSLMFPDKEASRLIVSDFGSTSSFGNVIKPSRTFYSPPEFFITNTVTKANPSQDSWSWILICIYSLFPDIKEGVSKSYRSRRFVPNSQMIFFLKSSIVRKALKHRLPFDGFLTPLLSLTSHMRPTMTQIEEAMVFFINFIESKEAQEAENSTNLPDPSSSEPFGPASSQSSDN